MALRMADSGQRTANRSHSTDHRSLITDRLVLSWGYWFGSRTQGLLVHPYVTMREIVRGKFFRPLTGLPMVVWTASWLAAVIIGRVGLWLQVEGLWWTVPLGRGLVFVWLWMSLFLGLWQVTLMYLYVRFRLTIPSTQSPS